MRANEMQTILVGARHGNEFLLGDLAQVLHG